MNPNQMLRDCIDGLHQLMQAMPDAKHVELINTALKPLLAIQTELSTSAQQTNPRQALLTQIAGGR